MTERNGSGGAGETRFLLGAAMAWVLVLTGCRQDMHNQPKMTPLRSTSMFVDGRSARAQVPNTVARAQQDPESYFMTGLVDGKEVDQMPFPATPDVLARGQERYNIYCSPCHSRVGNGQGMIVQRGYSLAADFHTERLREAPLGHFVNVIDHGQGTMPSYAAEVGAADRWAIAAYVRALQLSQNAAASDVPAGARVSPLAEVADATGLPKSFAEPWRAVVPQQTIAVARAQPTEAPGAASGPGASGPGATGPGDASVTAPKEAVAAGALGKTATDAPKGKPAAVSTAAMVAAGEKIYGSNCVACHQATRLGIPPAIPSLIGVVDKVGAARIHQIMQEGFPTGQPPMPAFPNLTDPEVDELIAYLKSAK